MAAWLELSVKTSALLLAAAALVGLMRRSSAASRHLVWTGMFAAALILPIARLALPAVPIPVWRSTEALAPPLQKDAVASEGIDAATSAPSTSIGTLSARTSLRPEAEPLRAAKWTLTGWLVAIWFTGMAFFLARVVIGTVGTRVLGGRATQVIDSRLLARLEQARRALNVGRPIALLVSPRPRMPATWGVVRPTILLPSAVASSFGERPEQLDAVLIHEVAHIARMDAVSQLMARVAVAVWWFNPLFWFAARQARLERERSCDDSVLALGSRPSDYASQLLAFVRALAPITASDALSMAHSSHLEQRVRIDP